MADLDKFVKDAPAGDVETKDSPAVVAVREAAKAATGVADPLDNIPSSPPQIYLNLLILEASLRAQWLEIRARRRQHTFFFTILGLWVIGWGYALFLAPREDGHGVGGSVYWALEAAEKLSFMGGIAACALVWGTGTWERGIRRPGKWVWNTNNWLRVFKCKLVIIRRPWWKETLSTLSFIFAYGPFANDSGSSFRYVDHSLVAEPEKAPKLLGHKGLPNIHENTSLGCEEDIAPGGDHIKIVLLPKPFTGDFRETWEVYRAEYWDKENERRACIRAKLKLKDRKLAKEQGGWLWWTGYRGWNRGKPSDIEKVHHIVHHNVHRQGSAEKEHKRTRSTTGSHSRNSSRGSTPTEEEPMGGHSRQGSTASERRKKKATGSRLQKLATAPDVRSPLARESSFTSMSSIDSDTPGTPGTQGDGDSVRSLRAPSRTSGSPARKSLSRAAKQSQS